MRFPDPEILPLAALNPGQPGLFQANEHWGYFARLRRDAPVHFTAASEYGPYWSVSTYRDILAVEANHAAFSSDMAYGGITLKDPEANFVMPMFIAMDPPRHDLQRAAVSPMVAPGMLARLGADIRARAGEILDALPIGEPFDWVDRVAIELTTQMLAILFDFPFEHRRRLTRWSDVATAIPGGGVIDSQAQRQDELRDCLAAFTALWNQRVNAPPRADLISLMAHDPATRAMPPMEYLGNIVLLIVGGNDTTRNSITGGLLALHQHPDVYTRLLGEPGLIPSMVPEIIRWQTPLAHMRRTCVVDTELGGQTIRAGEKVVMWYVSGNRDPTAIAEPDRFVIDRAHPKKHLSFGFGVHRCVGERLAEMQLRIVWEEILARFGRIEVLEEPRRVFSTFVHGYERLLVRIDPSQVCRRA